MYGVSDASGGAGEPADVGGDDGRSLSDGATDPASSSDGRRSCVGTTAVDHALASSIAGGSKAPEPQTVAYGSDAVSH